MQYLLDAARSRGLDRITVGYAVAAWAAVQAASIAAPAYSWPAWILQLVILSSLLGLPVVLLGAWWHGVRQSEAGHISRTDLHLLIVLGAAMLVLGGAGTAIFWPRAATQGAIREESAVPVNAVAVLPFANLSGDATKDYVSDGIADELLNNLAGRRELRVAARTSSFAFKGRNQTVQAIAGALHVRAVLEGSVIESGNRIRINAQLVNAADGFQLWSQSFDRDLTDILVVESDIARAITSALVRTLSPTADDQQASRSIDREAFLQYLRAKALGVHGNEDDLNAAAELLRKVTLKAQDFAPAYQQLAQTYLSLSDRYGKVSLLPAAENAAQQAINLDPVNVKALANLATIRLDQWKWDEALDLFRRMQAANPNQPDVLHMRSTIAYTFNFPAEDIKAELKAAELDPLQPALKYDIALWYWNEMRYGEALEAIRKVLALRKGKYQDIDMECLIEVGLGHLDTARRLSQSISSYYAQSPQNGLSCPFSILVAAHQQAAARALLELAAKDAAANGGSFITVAESYRTLGDLKAAMPWYERAYDTRDPLIMFQPYEKYQHTDLFRYPPWKALWSRPPIRAWESARAEVGKLLGVSH